MKPLSKNVRSRAHFVAGVLLICSVLQLLWFWGGAAQLPTAGQPLLAGAGRESPLRLTYMHVGRWITRAAGVREAAIASAERTLTPAGIERIVAVPDGAMDAVSSQSFGTGHALLKLNEWAAPVLFVVWLVLYLRRSKGVHFTRSRR